MNLQLTFLLPFLIGISISVIKVEGFRCYVCGDVEQPSCDDFDLKRDTFIQECASPDNKGCAKIFTGETKTVVRKCSDKGLDDCKKANGVEYCYCMTELCNSNLSKWTGATDDEDLVEGSGITTVSSEPEHSVVNKKKSLGSKVDLYRSLILISFVIMFYNN